MRPPFRSHSSSSELTRIDPQQPWAYFIPFPTQATTSVENRNFSTPCVYNAAGWGRYSGSVVRCASGCVVECRICNREAAGSNLGRRYFAPRSTQPSIPPGSAIAGKEKSGVAHSYCGWTCGCACKTEIYREHVPCLSASAVVIHYEGALYQVYAPLLLPSPWNWVTPTASRD